MSLISVGGKRLRYDTDRDDVRLDSDDDRSDSDNYKKVDDDDDDNATAPPLPPPSLFTSVLQSMSLPPPTKLPAPSPIDSLRASLLASLPSDFSLSELSAEIDALNAAQLDELSALIQRNVAAIANNSNPVAELPHQSGLSLSLHSAVVAAFQRRLPVNRRRMAETRRAKAKSARAIRKFQERNDQLATRLVASKVRAHKRHKVRY